MRALLPHSLRRLALCLSLVAVAPVPALCQIPQPIGHLSDYGAVLDRHGRERVNDLIEWAWTGFGVEVFILASWENLLASTDALAHAVADSWGLHEKGAALLLVLVKGEREWSHAVVGTGDLAGSATPGRLEEGIADLVAHRRIEESMVSFFGLLPDALNKSPMDRSAEQSEETRPATSLAIWLIPVVILAAGILLLCIRRFMCPRCGRLLRREASRTGHGVYSCRSCSYRRE